MAVLSANVRMDHRADTLVRTEVLAAVTDVFYGGAAIWWSTTAEGVTPVCASGTEFAGFCEEQVSATMAVTKIKLVNGVFKIPTAGASAQATQGQFVYGDASAGSDNPADLIFTGTASGDVGVGVALEYVSSTSCWMDSRVRTLPTVVA